jgi:hypothetical protein
MDRFALNSYIERLIDAKGHDEEARQVLAEFGSRLSTSKVSVEGVIKHSGDKFSGQTPQHGQIQIEDDKEQTKEFSAGGQQERVGYFKLAREKYQKERRISITHFWKADLETMSEVELPQQWVLATDQEGVPLWFGERGMKHITTLRMTKFVGLAISREMFRESWGPSPETDHKGRLVFALTVRIGGGDD